LAEPHPTQKSARFWLIFGDGDNDAVFDSARGDIVTVTAPFREISPGATLREKAEQ
jgi:hypothetical protein